MTQAEVLYRFFSSFGMPAYPSNAVPEDTMFPWLTYEVKTGYFGDTVSCAINLYYHTSSESLPNAKADEIGDEIGLGGLMLNYDRGAMWIRRAEPWCVSIPEADSGTKHKQLMTMIEFM